MRRAKGTVRLSKDDLLRAQLTHQCLEFHPADIIFEGAQIEQCTVKDANTERLLLILALSFVILSDRHTIARR